MRDATTGEIIGEASSAGHRLRARCSTYARGRGGPALREMTFHERAGLLKVLAKRLVGAQGRVLRALLSHGRDQGRLLDRHRRRHRHGLRLRRQGGARAAERPRVSSTAALEGLSKSGTFVGQHLYVPREGAAMHINAFNFPVWGMLEKLAPALSRGRAVRSSSPRPRRRISRSLLVRRIIESGILPEGALQLVCGSLGDLFDHLTCQDLVSFTGSAHTAAQLRVHPSVDRALGAVHRGDRFAQFAAFSPRMRRPAPAEFDLFIKEVVREMTVKAGQKCTAIRKALVPAAWARRCDRGARGGLAQDRRRRPARGRRAHGPPGQPRAARGGAARASPNCATRPISSSDTRTSFELTGADRATRCVRASAAAAVPRCRTPARAVHEVEAFGPVATVVPYGNTEDAIALARRSGGSLVASVFCADDALAGHLVRGLAPFHGRILVVNAPLREGVDRPRFAAGSAGARRTGPSGWRRGVRRHTRGIALHAAHGACKARPIRSPRSAGAGCAAAGCASPGVHPFRIPFNDLQLGDTFKSAEREVTVEDIERFAALTGDTFYAHMSDAEAAA